MNPDEVGISGALKAGPGYTFGFGPREDADSTRQAQQSFSNDTPTDVNFNAVVARSQAMTYDVFGKSWASNSDRREKIADAGMGKQMDKLTV